MSRRRPYLDLKASIMNLFRTPARWLHDTLQSESLFEKPYIDRDYRKMHLDIPNPDWPATPEEEGFFPDKPGTWTFKFDPGICFLGVVAGGCDKTERLAVSIGLLPPGSEDKTIVWTAVSSNEELIAITKIDQGISGTIHLQFADYGSETVTICVQGQLVGTIREELVVPWSGKGVLDYREAASLPALVDKKTSGNVYDCGCIDIAVSCDCDGASYDDGSSDDTIVRSSTATAAVTGAAGKLKTWTVTGTGFWLNAGYTITTLQTTADSVTVYADSNACGLGTVSACGATGYIRCTHGQWVTVSDNCDIPGTYTSKSGCCEYTRIQDGSRLWITFALCTQCPYGTAECVDCDCYDSCIDENPSGWCQDNMCMPFDCTSVIAGWERDRNCCGGDPSAGAQCFKCTAYVSSEWECY